MTNGTERTPTPKTPFTLHRDGPSDTLVFAVAKADALVAAIAGDGFEAFKHMNDDIQQNYLWALSCLLHDAKVASEYVELSDKQFA
jgi:hypothetical protein